MDGGLDQVFFSLPERGQGAEGSQPWPASLCAGNAPPGPPPRPPARAPPRSCLTSATVAVGLAEKSSAATPDTTGQE